MLKLSDFKHYKLENKKLVMVTCYDYTSARIVNDSEVDLILVGDSLAMVMHGYDSTVPATMEMMEMHTAMVARGARNKYIVGDLPFLSYRTGQNEAMKNIGRLMQAGAHMVKLEGCAGNENLIAHCVQSGVPVMGHLGLTPQSIHQIGGMKVQGRQPEVANVLVQEAKTLEELGCSALVLECVPSELAMMVSKQLTIPVIGIGAGVDVDGQVLVFQDMLGLNPGFKPKFLKTYYNGFDEIKHALNCYASEVKAQIFPDDCHSYD